jgi:predicted membrane protein
MKCSICGEDDTFRFNFMNVVIIISILISISLASGYVLSTNEEDKVFLIIAIIVWGILCVSLFPLLPSWFFKCSKCLEAEKIASKTLLEQREREMADHQKEIKENRLKYFIQEKCKERGRGL